LGAQQGNGHREGPRWEGARAVQSDLKGAIVALVDCGYCFRDGEMWARLPF